MSNEKYGFVYIWYDRKHKRYYVGCHWGTEDDGYICSSRWMRSAHRRRPDDFKRRIIKRHIDKETLLLEESRYLSMIKEEELRDRYYNLTNKKFGHWAFEKDHKTISEKISIRTKEAMQRPEVREKYEKGLERRDCKGSDPDTIEKRRQSMIETMAKKFPVENRRKPLSEEEKFKYYSQKGKDIWANRTESQKKDVGKKISEGLKGKQNRLGQSNTEEHRKKISESLKGKIHRRHRISVDGVEYESTKKASIAIGLSAATIGRRLKSDKYPEYKRI